MSESAERNGRAHLETIVEVYKAHEHFAEDRRQPDPLEVDGITFTDETYLDEYVHEMPLSVLVRSDWHFPGKEAESTEYEILLSTGGPALRIVGELDQYSQPTSANIQTQDWFEPWTDMTTTEEEDAALIFFVSCFYFGE